MFLKTFKGASQVSERSSKGATRKFQCSLKDILNKFQRCWKKVPSESFKKISKKSYKDVSRIFDEVLFCDFVVAQISLQPPKQLLSGANLSYLGLSLAISGYL